MASIYEEVAPEGSLIYLFNAGSSVISVPITATIVATGQVLTDTVFVQPNGKPYLAEGWQVSPAFAASPPRFFSYKTVATTSGD